jgi:hypothetical protein
VSQFGFKVNVLKQFIVPSEGHSSKSRTEAIISKLVQLEQGKKSIGYKI